MHATLLTMKRVFPHLNGKPYSYDDALKVAKRQKLSVTLALYDDEILGYYCKERQLSGKVKRYIVINEKLDPIERQFILLHELAHHFLHEPVSAWQWLYCRRSAEGSESKQDCEANLFALIAMIPLPYLIELERTDPAELHPTLISYAIKRRKLYAQRGE